MSKFAKCPCRGNKGHLGVHIIVPKQGEVSLKLTKSQRNFFLGHGIKTSDPKEAANVFIWRDHEKLLALLSNYKKGMLGVYMVPSIFFGQVPHAVVLSESQYKGTKYLDNIRGDIAEIKVFNELKEYFGKTGDDVLIIHSHKFLVNESNNEKDFILFNLSKGNIFSKNISKQ